MHDYDLTGEECLELLMMANEREDTAFHLAANNPDILLMLIWTLSLAFFDLFCYNKFILHHNICCLCLIFLI